MDLQILIRKIDLQIDKDTENRLTDIYNKENILTEIILPIDIETKNRLTDRFRYMNTLTDRYRPRKYID